MVTEKPEEDFFQDSLSFIGIYANLALLGCAKRNQTQIELSYAPETYSLAGRKDVWITSFNTS